MHCTGLASCSVTGTGNARLLEAYQAMPAAHQAPLPSVRCDVLPSMQHPGSVMAVHGPPFTPPMRTTMLAEQLTLQGTILPGVTRKSVIQLLQAEGYEVEETNVTVSEAMEADEVFTTGTAVVVCAVGSLTYKVGLRGSLLQLANCWLTRI